MHLLTSGPDVRPTVIRRLTQRDQILMPELAAFADPIEHWRAPGMTRRMDTECFACLTPSSHRAAAIKQRPWARRFSPLTNRHA
jgi:hypothetical protein